MFNHPHGSSLRYSKHDMPSYVPSFTTTLPHWHQSQPGKRSCSAAGFSWDDLLSKRLRATVHNIWMHDWNSFGLRTDWSALWAMVRAECDVAPVPHAEQLHSRSSQEFVKAPPVPSHRANCSRDQKSLPNRPRTSSSCTGPCVRPILVRSGRAHPHHTSQDATAQRTWTTRQSIGATLVLQPGTATCLCKLLHTLLPHQFHTLCYSASRPDRSRHSPKPTGGYRPLLRLALKSVMAAKKESVAKCAGPLQYGVGRSDGANMMIKTIQYLAEADPSRVLVALDLVVQHRTKRAELAAVFSK